MIRIEIESTQILSRSGTSSRTGKPYEIREQNALLFREGERYPDKIRIPVPEGRSAYQPGAYMLHDSSFSVSRFGALEVSRPVLVAMPAQAKPAAA